MILILAVLIICTGQNARLQQLTSDQQEVMRLYQEAQDEIKAATSTKTKSGGLLFALSPISLVKAYGSIIGGAINSSQKKKAISIYEKLIPLSEKAFGPKHPQTVIFMNDLGMLYEADSDFVNAELLYKKALIIREKTLGPNHSDVAETLNNLGRLYLTIGRYSNAEPLLQRAIEIREKSFGPDSSLVAECLLNLGNLYVQLADYDRADKMLNRSLSILEKSPGVNKMFMAQTLMNIADLYFEQNEYSRAETLVKKAIKIMQEKDSGATAFDAFLAYSMLVVIELANGDTIQSINTMAKSVELMRAAGLGQNGLITTPQVLAWWIHYREFILLTNKAVMPHGLVAPPQKVFGPDHPEIATVFNNEALYEVHKKKYSAVIPNSKRAMEIIYKSISDVFVIASENLKLKFLAKNELYRDVLFSGILGDKPSAENTTVGLTWELRLKGMVLESMIGEREVFKKGLSPELRATYEELQQVRQELASLYVKGPSVGDDSYIKNMTELEARKDGLEAKISQGSSAFKESREALYVTPDAVCAKMPKGSALIEYVEFKNYGGGFPFPDWMAAFVLEEGNCAAPTMVNLGPADKIEAAVKSWREELQAFPTSGMDEANARNKLDERGRAVAELVWKPIVKAMQASPLQSKSVVYISPDGPLHMMPMGALPEDGGGYLIEKVNIGVVSSGKDFTRSHKTGTRIGALMVGGVDFNAGAAPQAPTQVALVSASTRGQCGKLDELQWNMLPGTVAEVDAISVSFGKNNIPVTLLKGLDGQEAKVRNGFGNARYIHLATHGFFLGDECGLAEEARGIGGVRPGTQGAAVVPVQTTSVRKENPLLLSGLALAGANNAWRGGAGGGDNDGYLLAIEVANLDLEGVELVTLSACQTGLGEIRRGEGVFGLKRSFMIAGAEALVMSLWSVPDKETKDLMVDFYNRILGGAPKRESFRQSQLNLMKSGPGGSYRHPYFWAAFQYIGVN